MIADMYTREDHKRDRNAAKSLRNNLAALLYIAYLNHKNSIACAMKISNWKSRIYKEKSSF
jgi:hypothetical protein